MKKKTNENILLICNLNINLNINPEKIIYRDYKLFDEAKFPHDLDQYIIKGSFCQYEEAFAVFPSVFSDVVNRNAPLKQKTVRGNNAPFMTKQLNKAIMHRSKIKNR